MACSKEAACRRQISAASAIAARRAVLLEGDQDWSAGWHVSRNGAWRRPHRRFWVFGERVLGVPPSGTAAAAPSTPTKAV